MKRTQSRFRYLLPELPESVEIIIRQHGLPISWDDYPIYNLSNADDVKKLDAVVNFFWEIENAWTSITTASKNHILKVN